MRYSFKPRAKLYVLITILGGSAIWVIITLICTAFVPGGGPVSSQLKRLLIAPSYFTALIVAIYYATKYSYKVALENGMLCIYYSKLRKKADVLIYIREIKIFEIVYLDNDPVPDCYNVYTSDSEPAEFGTIVPVEDVLSFCQQNNIIPLSVTISMKVYNVVLKNKHVSIEYYGKPLKTITIKADDIRTIELERFHPISHTRDQYKIYTVSGEEYVFEYYLVKREVLDSYASAHGFSVTEKQIF